MRNGASETRLSRGGRVSTVSGTDSVYASGTVPIVSVARYRPSGTTLPSVALPVQPIVCKPGGTAPAKIPYEVLPETNESATFACWARTTVKLTVSRRPSPLGDTTFVSALYASTVRLTTTETDAAAVRPVASRAVRRIRYVPSGTPSGLNTNDCVPAGLSSTKSVAIAVPAELSNSAVTFAATLRAYVTVVEVVVVPSIRCGGAVAPVTVSAPRLAP